MTNIDKYDSNQPKYIRIKNAECASDRFVTSFPGVLCEVSFLRWGVRKLPAADLATTPGAVVESSPKGKSNVALPPLLPQCQLALAALLLPVYKTKKGM